MKKLIKKIILIILLIILISILGFLIINITRKFLIFNKISNKLSSLDFSNYYCKFYMDVDEKYLDESLPNYTPAAGAWEVFKQYNESQISETPLTIEASISEGKFRLSKLNNVYIKLDENISINEKFTINPFYRWNENKTFTDKLNLALNSKIKTVDFNNTKCYEITLKYNYHQDLYNTITIYIDKDSLLKVGEKIKYENKPESLYYFETKFNTLLPNEFSVKKLLNGYKNLNSNEEE